MIRRSARFTLPEVIAVIVILGLLTALALPSLREASPADRLRQASLEFEAFCARVRLQATEQGKDRAVSYDPAERVFRMTDPSADTFSAKEFPSFRWKLPSGFEFTGDSGQTELFRFFPDGSASGKRKLIFRCGKLRQVFQISLLTGQLRSHEASEDEEEEE